MGSPTAASLTSSMGDAGPSPYSVHMDPDMARDFAQQGATVLMLGVPAGAIVGVDHQAFSAGPKLKGVKMLPPGPHFFSCRAASNTGNGPAGVAPPTSFFLHLAPRQVVVKAWDAGTEQLLDMRDEEEAERYAEGCRRFDFDSGLAPYDLGSYRRWAGLVSHVSAELIEALSPLGGNISVMAEAEDPELLNPKTEAERELVESLRQGRDKMQQRVQQQQQQQQQSSGPSGMAEEEKAAAEEELKPSMSAATTAVTEAAGAAAGSGRCFYTHLPRLVKQRGLSAAELTSRNLDKSAVVLQVASERYQGKVEGLLGEMQFAFAAFVFGQSLDGFEQWKAILTLLLGCEEAALHSHPAAYAEFLRCVSAQLGATVGGSAASAAEPAEPSPFGLGEMVEELLPDSFLKKSFGSFFQMLEENASEVSAETRREAQALKQLLRVRLGWEYDILVLGEVDVEEDDMPVVVDTEEPWAM